MSVTAYFCIVLERRDEHGCLIDFDALRVRDFRADFSKPHVRDLITAHALDFGDEYKLDDLTVRVYDEDDNLLGLYEFDSSSWYLCGE